MIWGREKNDKNRFFEKEIGFILIRVPKIYHYHIYVLIY